MNPIQWIGTGGREEAEEKMGGGAERAVNTREGKENTHFKEEKA